MSLPVEQGLISKIIQTGNLAYVKDMQIGLDFFTGDNKSAFRFIQETVIETGGVPTARVFETRFPDYPLEYTKEDGEHVAGTAETLEFWCEEIRKKKKHDTMVDTLQEVVGLLNEFDTENSYSELKKLINYIERDVELSPDVDITKDTDKRKEAYLEKRRTRGMMGISTGIPMLDYLTKGLKPETLTTIIANTGVGKTWLEILIGAHAMLNGNRVIQFVTEMSEDIMRDRYEAMLFALMYEGFDYKKFKSGLLSKEVEKQFFQFLEDDLPKLEPLYVATATGVMNMEATIEKYWPVDLVLVDGVYLMDDDQGADADWLRVAHITRDLKRLMKRRKLPGVINTQADKNTSKKTGPELGDISYTQAIGQDSDDIWALFRDAIMFADSEMCLKLLKQREGETGKIMMNWDFTSMNFTGIYSENSSSEQYDENGDIKEEQFEDDDAPIPVR